MKRITITYVLAFLCVFFLKNQLNAQTCATPTNITTTSTSAINANLTWSSVVGAYYYKIKINPVGSPNLIKNYTSANNSLLAAALLPMQDYECRIATVCAAGVGAYSSPSLFSTTSSSTCGVPQGISSFGITSSNVSVKWTAVAGAQSYLVKIFQNGVLKKASPITKSPIVITGLQSNTAYTYTVSSICSGIPGADSAPLAFTTLNASSCGIPTGVTASNVTNLGAKIKWNEVPGANSYKVTITAVAIPIPITHTNITGTSYDLFGLAPNSAFTYKVSAVCSGVEGISSPIGTFTTAGLPCLQPSFVNVSGITATTANVGFIKGATGNNAITRLFLKEVGQTLTKTFSSASGTIALSGLLPNTAYEYQLASVCNGNQNELSSAATFTTAAAGACLAPTNISVINVTSSKATISWLPIAGISTYTVSLIMNDSIITKYKTTGFSFTVNNLIPNMACKATVSAHCIPSIEGTPSLAANFTTLPSQNCASPASLNVFDINVTKARFAWTPVAGVTKYRLMVRKIGTTTPIYTETFFPTTVLSNLEPNKTYEACVTSVCGAEMGEFCPTTTFSTLLDGNCPPPTNVSASNITLNSAKIAWDSLPGTTSWSLLIYPSGMPNMNYIGTSSAYFTAKNLLPNKMYDVVVVANCPFSTLSMSSTTFSFVTQDYPTCTDSYEPNNTVLTASQITASSVVNGGIHTAGDKDYYKITTTATQPYLRIKLSNLPADFDLKLLTAAGTFLSSSEKLGTTNEVITFNNPLPANFTILVYGFGNTFVPSKCYQLLVETSSTPFGGGGSNISALVQSNEGDKSIQTPIEPFNFIQKNENTDFKIYPNPASSELNVHFSDEFKGNTNILLSDAQGRVVLTESFQVENSNNDIRLDLSNFNNGLYLLSVKSNDLLKTYKVLIHK